MLRELQIKRLLMDRYPTLFDELEALANNINDKDSVFIDKYRLYKILFTGIQLTLIPSMVAGRLQIAVAFNVPYEVERELFKLLDKKEVSKHD